MRNNLYGCAMSKFLPTSSFKWIHPKKFDLNKYTSNSSKKKCILEVDLEYPKDLSELHNVYPLGTAEIEIKREMLYEYKFKTADLYNILLAMLKN